MERPLNVKHSLRALKALEGPFPETDFTLVPETPQALFLDWLEAAIAAEIIEPHAMTLSTVDEEGLPDARVLILKNLDERGWHFAINSSSPKGRQIQASPGVALTFYWPKLGRQVRIRGRANKLDAEESAQDYRARSLEARATVLLDKQSELLEDQQHIEAAMSKARSRVEAEPDLVTPNWCVYAVEALQVEFWQGANDRLHQRLRLTRMPGDGQWKKQFLWP